ncbi:hypothetical protein Tco_0725342 [Tanacetum coccineum]|uniref:Reverse transcriptase Ty1/copia-type domain-containing protein n=1 Tax=Tanacetum coccineum TaxID=301880 RepID=A0ABQ4YDI1_9ASTR
MIRGIMYLTTSRSDIVFATFVCARYQARPIKKHLKEVKRIFCYLRQTINMDLWYSKGSGFELIAYSDADLARCLNDYKSTSRRIQFLGDKLISWSSKKQDCTALSTAEADIPCSPECKIVGQILLDHPLSYALTPTTDVPVVYLQQFWKTFSKVPNTKDTIKFKLDTQEIAYTVDMFRDTLHFPVETLDNPFIAPVDIKDIESFMQKVGYQGVVDKVSAFFTKFLSQPWQTMNVLFQGMSILDEFLTDEIRATDDYKEYETVFGKVDVPINQPQPVVSTQGTHRTTPRAHRSPTLTAASP